MRSNSPQNDCKIDCSPFTNTTSDPDSNSINTISFLAKYGNKEMKRTVCSVMSICLLSNFIADYYPEASNKIMISTLLIGFAAMTYVMNNNLCSDDVKGSLSKGF
ncbi:MAG: hypothetical protein ISQ32_03760 [Rickettsiales bacterium]|nr:hypothetical protein [Rickettsiales bacterium]